MGQSAGFGGACDKDKTPMKMYQESTQILTPKAEEPARLPVRRAHVGEILVHDINDCSRSSSKAETESSFLETPSSTTRTVIRRRSTALQRHLSTLAAGHGGNSILKDFHGPKDIETGVPEYVIKAYDEVEATAYRELEAGSDELLRFTARFCGEMDVLEREALAKDLGVKQDTRYMRLSNLMKKFTRGPNVMDCKIGTRSFRESERKNTTLRPDLFVRMLEADPRAPTEEERKMRACTKYRWMSYNDGVTGLDTLGYRIDGIAHSKEEGRVAKSVLKQARTLDDTAKCIAQHFLPQAPPAGKICLNKCVELDSTDKDVIDQKETQELCLRIAGDILSQLKELRGVMRKSIFVGSHEFVGSSLLFIADAHASQGGVFLIDFAKVTPLPVGVTVSHQTQWMPGNYEDGLLVGMDSMILCWERVVELVTEGSLLASQRKPKPCESLASASTTMDLPEASTIVSDRTTESTPESSPGWCRV